MIIQLNSCRLMCWVKSQVASNRNKHTSFRHT